MSFKLKFWASVGLFILLAISHNFAQTAKTDKCDKAAECLQTFFRECYDESFLETLAPKQVDSLGIANYEEEMARLDNYFISLNNEPEDAGFIVVYGGHVSKFGELKERVKRLQTYIKKTGFDAKRITFVQGGFRQKFEFEFWISPTKKAFPPLSPTVDVEKVRFSGKMKPLPTMDY